MKPVPVQKECTGAHNTERFMLHLQVKQVTGKILICCSYCEKNYRHKNSIVKPLKDQNIYFHCFFSHLHFAKYKNKVKEFVLPPLQ